MLPYLLPLPHLWSPWLLLLTVLRRTNSPRLQQIGVTQTALRESCLRFRENLTSLQFDWQLHPSVGFDVLTAVSTKMAVFWVVAPCSLVEAHQRFRGTCCIHHQGVFLVRTMLWRSCTIILTDGSDCAGRVKIRFLHLNLPVLSYLSKLQVRV
jgi:hypothetical protein